MVDGYSLAITLRVGRACVERPEAASTRSTALRWCLRAKDLVSHLLVCVKGRCQIPLLLLDMFERLVHIILLALRSQ